MAMKRHEGLLAECVTVRLSLHRRPPSLQQLWLLMALMIRNPTKHTVSGAKTDLRWACRNTLYGATFQAYQLYMASSRRPPHMRKAENSGFSNASGRNLQNY